MKSKYTFWINDSEKKKKQTNKQIAFDCKHRVIIWNIFINYRFVKLYIKWFMLHSFDVEFQIEQIYIAELYLDQPMI